MKTKIVAIAQLVVALLLCFAGTAFAADQASASDASFWEFARRIYDAVMHGQYWIAAASALVLCAAAARKYLQPRYPWARSAFATSLLILMASYGGALGTALAADKAVMSTDLALAALKIAIAAAGGYGILKGLLDPLRSRLGSMPAWLQRPLKLLFWAFDHMPAQPAPARAQVRDSRDGEHAEYTRQPSPPPARRDHRP